jgi:tetrahydromethanopterin S-methyltransferase subunit F
VVKTSATVEEIKSKIQLIQRDFKPGGPGNA